MRLSALMWIAAFLILGMAERPIMLSTATVFFGLGNGVVFSALSILIAELVPAPLLGRATALSSTAMFLGQFISPLVLGPVMAATSIATGYLAIAGAAALILLALIAIRVPIADPCGTRLIALASIA